MFRTPPQSARTSAATAVALAVTTLLAACATSPTGTLTRGDRTATVRTTEHGVPHITASDPETLAYATAWAHARDNVCQTANQLVTVRGQRARFFGGDKASGLLGRRLLPNEQIDFFIAAHMDDAALARASLANSAEARALEAGYVAGYNRYLRDRAGELPAACKGQPWVQPMTLAEFRRLNELTTVQAGIAALADGALAAQPPKPAAATSSVPPAIDLADAAEAMREAGVIEPRMGSNAWAFGADTTANGSGVLLGNPHFPWQGVNRFWQMHLTLTGPGGFDVMGASVGHSPVVQIGFNKDVAWSHTVSTGKRFTLHELALQPGEPTAYLIDGQPEKMQARTLKIQVRQPDGTLADKTHTWWSTRWGPVVVVPRAGLNWTAAKAYALRDANTRNARAVETWLGFSRATKVDDLTQAMRNLGLPWVNTIAADRHGQALYADLSVVPDVDASLLQRCAPSPQAAALRGPAGLFVLDGSRSACGWNLDVASPVPGLIPRERMPVAVRRDWVQNSNDSFVYTHPAQRFTGVSPLVGDAQVTRPRTRASLTEIPAMLADGKVTPAALQQRLFGNRNYLAGITIPDLLAACALTPPADAAARDGCTALRGWSRTSDGDARGAHLFREFWRTARAIPSVWRVPFNPAQPIDTPMGLKMDDAATADKVWAALAGAVTLVRKAGFALDAPLNTVQHAATSRERIGLHGGDEFEGVLNNMGNVAGAPIGAQGLPIDYGTSYVQTVTFDARGPVVQAILTYGQSTDPASPHSNDQTRLFAAKRWPVLPFHADDVARAQVGETLKLTRP
jgi:acyl-homoserine-lactone acylase